MSDKKAKCTLSYHLLGWLEITSPTGYTIRVRTGSRRNYTVEESSLIDELVKNFHHKNLTETSLTYDQMTLLKTASEKRIAQRFVQLVYDIPTAITRDTGFTPPYRLLHRVAVPFNLSCWDMPLCSVPQVQEFIDELAARKLKHRVVRYDVDEQPKIQESARQALMERASDLQESLLRSIDSATRKYDEAVTNGTAPDKAQKYQDWRYKQILKTASDGLNAAVLAAELFDETMSVYDLFDGLRKVIAVQQTILNIQLS